MEFRVKPTTIIIEQLMNHRRLGNAGQVVPEEALGAVVGFEDSGTHAGSYQCEFRRP